MGSTDAALLLRQIKIEAIGSQRNVKSKPAQNIVIASYRELIASFLAHLHRASRWHWDD
jgi:hypothetical protein